MFLTNHSKYKQITLHAILLVLETIYIKKSTRLICQ